MYLIAREIYRKARNKWFFHLHSKNKKINFILRKIKNSISNIALNPNFIIIVAKWIIYT